MLSGCIDAGLQLCAGDRLTAVVQHQPSQIAVALGPLVLSRHRGAHIRHEQRQLHPDPVHFKCVHPPNMLSGQTDEKT
jgi:hypothetical protein